MPETTEQTKTGGSAASAGTTSEPASSTTQDPTSNQPATTAQVESGNAEGANRNTDPSDGGSGGDGNGAGRNRPSRAEREIKDLKSQIKELQSKFDEQNDLSQRLQSTKVSPSDVNLPDYSQMTEVTPQQLQQDIVKAAEQIVDVKMGALAKTLTQQVDAKNGSARALQEIEDVKKTYKVLDHSDEEHYNKELDESIGSGFLEIFKNNPNYSFAEYIKSFKPVLDIAEQAATHGTGTGVGSNRGLSANRSTASSRRSQKAPEDMSLDELEAYIHTQNAR